MSHDKDTRVPMIELSENGPYVVKNLSTVRNSKGENLPTKDVVALCRCGGSSNKPFCDGTHAKIEFRSKNVADGSKDKRDNYVGSKITIHDNRAICAHAGLCTDGLPAVWRMGVEPWIDADGGEVDAIIKTVEKCPSGALSYSIENIEHRDQDREPMITVAQDGPYLVTGGINLDVPRGQGASTEHYTLCRCGGSKNKPFCDGTHWHVKFKDEKN